MTISLRLTKISKETFEPEGPEEHIDDLNASGAIIITRSDTSLSGYKKETKKLNGLFKVAVLYKGEERGEIFVAADKNIVRIDTTAQSALAAQEEVKEQTQYSADMVDTFDGILASEDAKQLLANASQSAPRMA